MTKAEKLRLLKEQQNPALRVQRLATERLTAKTIGKMELVKGEQGPPGDDGYTPIKGKDYFTQADIKQITDFLIPKIKGEKGEPGKDAKGRDGVDGYTPVKGVDYWTRLDQVKMVQDVLANIKIPKDGVSPNVEEIAKKVTEQIQKKPIHFKDIKGTEELIAYLKLGGFRGGGGSSSGGGSGTVTSAALSGGTTGLTVTGSPITTSGTFTLVNPSSASTASQLMARDANQNAFANNFVAKATNVSSAGGTTTLTAASAHWQNLTGSSNQTFQLPDATTLTIGSNWQFNNNSSGILTVKDGGGTTLFTIPTGGQGFATLVVNVVIAGVWDYHFTLASNVSSGTSGMVVGGTISASNLSGTNTGDQTLNSLLPTQTGNNGKFLTTDGSNSSWGTPASGGSPGGSTTQVQFNDSGSFGGMKIDYTDDTVSRTLKVENAVGATDNGEDLIFRGANGGATSGDGAGFSFETGTSTLGNGGSITGNRNGGGAGSTGAAAATFIFEGGDSNDPGYGGSIALEGGTGSVSGGDFTVYGGEGTGDGIGGTISLNGGYGGGTSGAGGSLNLSAGSAQAGDSDGGSVTVGAGQKSGSGSHGRMYIHQSSGLYNFINDSEDFYAILDTSAVATSDKTFTLNNSSGGFVVADGNTTTSAPSTTATPVFTSYYGGNTKALGDPVAWIAININGVTYKLPLYS